MVPWMLAAFLRVRLKEGSNERIRTVADTKQAFEHIEERGKVCVTLHTQCS